MHTVVRNYAGKGAKELLALLDQHKAELDGIFRGIKGFVSYVAVKTDSGSFTVTVCETKAGTDESVAKAREWLVRNGASLGLAAPTIAEGAVTMRIS